MKQPSIKHYLIIGFVLVVIFSSIPFRQVVEVTKTVEYTSNDEYYVEIGFGGPKVTWVKVMCNRTAEIRFMYQSGVWVSQENILLATFRSTVARYDFNAEHTTNMIEVISEGPILVQIVYTYLTEMESSLFDRFLNTFRIY